MPSCVPNLPGNYSDAVLIFVCLGEFHFYTVENDVALLRILVGDEAGSIKLRMVVSVASAGNILVFGDTVAVRSHGAAPGGLAGVTPGTGVF